MIRFIFSAETVAHVDHVLKSMNLLTCPQCGAQVPFASKISVFAVCQYCNSTILRDDVELKLLGEMAALQDDYSVLQKGTSGYFDGKEFRLVGRVQYSWERGNWTEWFLFFPDNSYPGGGWLAEAQGFYAVSFQEVPSSPLPTLEDLSPGTTIELQGAEFTVADIKTSSVSFSEGELPFVATKGTLRTSVDLSGSNEWFACIEYHENETLLFLGKYQTFTELQLQNVKELDGW